MSLVVRPLNSRNHGQARDLRQGSPGDHLVVIGNGKEVHAMPYNPLPQLRRGADAIRSHRMDMQVSL